MNAQGIIAFFLHFIRQIVIPIQNIQNQLITQSNIQFIKKKAKKGFFYKRSQPLPKGMKG